MGKIFLSHSSKDKKYVSYIADQFGKDKCVYDELCFEIGCKNMDEIVRELDKTSIFVVFLSNEALNSTWVKDELVLAEEYSLSQNKLLSQIFPIIIDSTIDHKDLRIPDFLKSGLESYNLRVILDNRVAFRKIKAQQKKLLLENPTTARLLSRNFYGRDTEISEFKSNFEVKNLIKCMIASGIPNIGRSSFLLECLYSAKIIEDYYTPPTISLQPFDTLDDLIVKLSEIGFGNYFLDDVTSFDSDKKVKILIEIFSNIQRYNELVLIYDEGCLVTPTRQLVQYLCEALHQVKNQITILIASKYVVSHHFLSDNEFIYAQNLTALKKTEILGLLRTYGQSKGVNLTEHDRSFFLGSLNGYPLQIKYCIDCIVDSGIEKVRKEPHLIVEAFSSEISTLVDALCPVESREDYLGLLAFTSTYGIVPTDLLQEIFDNCPKYEGIYNSLKIITVFRVLGISGEYVEVNPTIADYIQRARIELPYDIRCVLERRLEKFNQVLTSDSEVANVNFEDLKYYLKENVKNNRLVPDRFMYSTLYLSSIYELYNNQKYNQLIILVGSLKENGSFARYENAVQTKIQNFYCRSLAREQRKDFYQEVQFYNQDDENRDGNEFNYLNGFMEKRSSNYGKALHFYQEVLRRNPKNKSAMREIVSVYLGLEDYSSAVEFARYNYLTDVENPYHIKSYFEIIIRQNNSINSNNENSIHVEKMLHTMEKIHSTKPTPMYYEIYAQYLTFVENQKEKAQTLLDIGLTQFPNSSYLAKTYFDCGEFFSDVQMMETSLGVLSQLKEESKSIALVYKMKSVIFDAYNNKHLDLIIGQIRVIKGINSETKNRLENKVTQIRQNNIQV